MWVERIEQNAFVSIEHANPQIFGPPCLAFQLRKLVKHFAFRRIQRADKRAIEPHERSSITLQKFAQSFFARVETAGKSARQSFLFHAPAQMLMPAENVANFKPEFSKQACDGRFDNRKARARENR